MSNESFPWPAVVVPPIVETRTVEYKEGVLWAEIEPKIYRAILAMANMEDVGYVIVGVSEDNSGNLRADGIDDATWRSYPKLKTLPHKLASAGYPIVDVAVEEQIYGSRRFLLVSVRPSSHGPVMCTRTVKPEKGIRSSTIYYRTTSRESRPAEAVDWQEMLSRYGKDEYAKGYSKGESASNSQTSAASSFQRELEGF